MVNSNSGNKNKFIVVLGMVLAGITCLGGGIYLALDWWNFECRSGQKKVNGACISSNLKPQKFRSNQTFNRDWISNTDRVIYGGSSNKDRDLGLKAFKNGNFDSAVDYFQKAVFSTPNDPEVQIYLNNAKAAKHGSPLIIAAVVSVDNRDSAGAILKGIADAQTRFNDSGGVGGRLVQIIIANDGNQPERSGSIARVIAKEPQILGVIGHHSSRASQAALDEYEKAGLAMISPTSTSTNIRSHYFFRTIPSDAATGKKLAEYAIETGIKKVAIFYNPNSSYSNSLTEAFKINFQRLGGKVIDLIDIHNANFDPREPIQTIEDQVEAIALFPNTDTISVAIGIARANRESGQNLVMLGGDSLYSSQTLHDGGSTVEGLVIAVPWFEMNQAYADAANQRWIGAVNWRTATSFDATQALLHALETDATRASVLQNLKFMNLSDDETAGEQLAFVGGERQGEPILVQIVLDAGGTQNLSGRFELIP